MDNNVENLTQVQQSHVEKRSWDILCTDCVVCGDILDWLRQFPSSTDMTYALKSKSIKLRK